MKALVLLAFMPLTAAWSAWAVQRVWFWHLTDFAPAPSVPALAAVLLLLAHVRLRYRPELEVDWEYTAGVIIFSLLAPLWLLAAAWVIEVFA